MLIRELRESLDLTQTEGGAAQALPLQDDGRGGKRCRTLEQWETGATVPLVVTQEGVLARYRQLVAASRKGKSHSKKS